MAKLIPAILSKDPVHIDEQLSFLGSFPEITDVQIDFADGGFVPNETALPGQLFEIPKKLKIEAHMMTFNPQKYLHDLEELGVDLVIVHYECFRSREQIESTLRNIKSLGMKCGLAANPQTELDVFDAFINRLDLALILGVNPGFQGQPFIQDTYERLNTLRRRHRDAIIEVDGGVKLENFGEILGTGIDRIVVGSGIWVTPDPGKTIREFLEILT